MANFSKSEVNAAKKVLSDAFAEVWGEGSSMHAWSVKNHTGYVMPNGYLVTFDKPSIETRFCFGWSTDYSGHECSDAERLREECMKSEEYFLEENLNSFRERREALVNADRLVWIKRYDGRGSIMDLTSVDNMCSISYTFYAENNEGDVDDECRNAYIKALDDEIEKFTKRLHVYLKRYGMSKLKSWTYWKDI